MKKYLFLLLGFGYFCTCDSQNLKTVAVKNDTKTSLPLDKIQLPEGVKIEIYAIRDNDGDYKADVIYRISYSK